jgi:hypothetical protein
VGPEHLLRIAGLLAALLPVPGDQRLDRGGLLGHDEQRPGAFHDLPADRRPAGDPPGQGRGGHGLDHPVPAQHVDRFGVAHDGHVDHPLEQRCLGAEPHVHGARRHPGAPGHRLQRGGHVAIGEEQLGGGGHDPLLGQRGLRLPQGCPLATGVDVSSHTLQYNCKE